LKTGSLKRWTEYVLIISGSVVLLTALVVVVALMVCDDDDYRRLAAWGVEHATGYRMIIEGPFALDLSAEPSLTADRIRFEAVLGGPSPPLKSIGNFHIKIALKPLLRGTLDGKTFKLSATGSIASVIQHKQAVFDGVNLRLSLKASDTHTIFKLLGMQSSDLGAVDGRLVLTGGGEKLKAKNLQLFVRFPKGLEIAATGGVGYIGLEKNLPLREIDVWLSAKAPNLGRPAAGI
jgi:hypothetical protein